MSRPPSSVVDQRARCPLRSERKAMRLPSGSQSGLLSMDGLVVNCEGGLPSEGTTPMSPAVPGAPAREVAGRPGPPCREGDLPPVGREGGEVVAQARVVRQLDGRPRGLVRTARERDRPEVARAGKQRVGGARPGGGGGQ